MPYISIAFATNPAGYRKEWLVLNFIIRFRIICRYHGNISVDLRCKLSSYQFFDAAPIQFESSLHAQVNWHYDTGHNVPADLCPPETSCSVEYDVMTYLHLAAPVKASNVTFPWGP